RASPTEAGFSEFGMISGRSRKRPASAGAARTGSVRAPDAKHGTQKRPRQDANWHARRRLTGARLGIRPAVARLPGGGAGNRVECREREETGNEPADVTFPGNG